MNTWDLPIFVKKLIYEQPLGEMWSFINDFYLFTDPNHGNE